MAKIVNNKSDFAKATPDKLSIINRRGAVLLVVLFIIMAITILSLGFLSRSDVELACGQNMILHTQMDYLAESGLEHAKGLILNPQDIAQDYWTGATHLQLDEDSSDFYDINVVRDGSNYCNYIIDCNAYREKTVGQDTIRVGQSSLSAELRLDPCIALSVGQSTTLWDTVTVYGDVNCVGTLTNQGNIYGDIFGVYGDKSTGTIKGQKYAVTDLLLTWPNINPADFKSKTDYYYPSGHTLDGDDYIPGMLLVEGNLTISGTNNSIVAGKNLPALYVTGDLTIESNASLDVNGLAVFDGDVFIRPDNTKFSILGGLFIRGKMAEATVDSSGYGHKLVLYNGPTWRSSGGKTAGALEFDGIDDYGQTSDSDTKLQLTSSLDYTLSVWINPNATQNNWAGIFSKCDPTGLTNHWTLQFDTSTPKKVIIYHPTGSWDTNITLAQVSGAWHHIVIVRNGSDMTSYLDPNGISPKKARSGSWSMLPGNGLGHLNIGADRTASPSYVYGGLIDDVRIYNRALDTSEVYSPPNDPNPNLIAHWSLDDSGNSGMVTITAAPTKTAVLLGSQGSQHWGQAAGAFFRSIKRQ